MKLLPPLTVENIKAMAVKHGVATDEEVDAVVDDLYAIARDSTTFVATPRIVQVWGRNRRMTDQHYYMIRGGIEGRERLRVLSRVMRPGHPLPLRARRHRGRNALPGRRLRRR